MSASHFIRAHLGITDPLPATAPIAGTQVTAIDLVSGRRTLDYGVGRVLSDAARLGMAPSETALDLLILAALVYAADTRIPRLAFSQDSWTREIQLEMPVAEPERWTANAALLRRMLRFLSVDIWTITFRPRPRRLQRLTMSRPQKRPAYDPICLFSGGLDSLVGAIDVLAGGHSPLLISHAAEGATSDAQNTLLDRLRRKYAGVDRLRFWIAFPKNLLNPSGSVEESTRARSFLFFAAAAFAAGCFAEGTVPIIVPENGLISLNVPLDPLRLGSLSTRTTHPFYMARWNELLAGIAIPARLENPYQFRTKGEMLAACTDQDLLSRTLTDSMSCSSPTKGRWTGRSTEHCGYCVPCLIRRAAIEAAFGDDGTPYTLADLHAGVLNTTASEGRQVRSFQIATERVRQSPALAAALIHKPGPLNDRLLDLAAFTGVYQRGMLEVGVLLQGVTAGPG
jgi:hypothetical protein